MKALKINCLLHYEISIYQHKIGCGRPNFIAINNKWTQVISHLKIPKDIFSHSKVNCQFVQKVIFPDAISSPMSWLSIQKFWSFSKYKIFEFSLKTHSYRRWTKVKVHSSHRSKISESVPYVVNNHEKAVLSISIAVLALTYSHHKCISSTAKYGLKNVVKILLENPVIEVNAKDDYDCQAWGCLHYLDCCFKQTATDYAIREGHEEIVQLLQEHGGTYNVLAYDFPSNSSQFIHNMRIFVIVAFSSFIVHFVNK